jgi:hypothetical protein
MPQWRKLHSKITESLDVNDMPDDFTRLLWVLLPTQLCREGRGVDNPSWVRSRVFPMREDVTLKMVSGALLWYAQRGMIVRYEVAGRAYFCVPTFHHYQGNTEREAQSEYPAPPENIETDARPTRDLLMSRSVSDSDSDSDVDADSDADVEIGAASAPPAQPEPVVVVVQEPEPKRASRADPRTKHPAISLVKGITGRNPNRAMYDSIIETVGDKPRGEDAAICYREWIKRGYNPNALTWLTEWYSNGIPTNGHGPRGSPLAAVDAAIEEYGRQERERQRGNI